MDCSGHAQLSPPCCKCFALERRKRRFTIQRDKEIRNSAQRNIRHHSSHVSQSFVWFHNWVNAEVDLTSGGAAASPLSGRRPALTPPDPHLARFIRQLPDDLIRDISQSRCETFRRSIPECSTKSHRQIY